MTTTSTEPRPLLVQPEPLDAIATPFAGDLLERKAVADRLTQYIDRLQVGAVVAIDAPWGEGKSWFGRHWAASLEQRGHHVAFVDAFGQDYAEDAFLVLSGAILKLCANNVTVAAKVKHSAGEVMRAVLPVGTKALIHLAATAVGAPGIAAPVTQALGLDVSTDEFGEAAQQAGDQAGDATSAWVKRRLDHWAEEQKSVEGFRKILREFAQESFEKTGKPVVILVDELDRCRPAFAVRLLERIKHFFDVPNLVFVLLMNRDQLEKAVRGVYGNETDAAAYVGKFLHLSLRLPKSTSRDVRERGNPTRRFVAETLSRNGLTASDFTAAFAACATAFNLSLREVERGCILYALMENDWPELTAYLIALRLRHPNLYRDLQTIEGMVEANKACEQKLLMELAALHQATGGRSPNMRDIRFPGGYFHALLLLHRYRLNPQQPVSNFMAEGGAPLQQALNDLHLEDALETVMLSLDLDVR
ncbi:KAP family P-loop domain protein [compost metagenome]